MSEYKIEYQRQYRIDKKDQIRERGRVRWLARYNLTPEQYSEMYERQGGKCRICRRPETQKANNGLPKPLAVDHDHSCCPEHTRSCGKCNRGLLCTRCNAALGMVGDSRSLLKQMILYLEGKM
jgi:hypothetical protein